MSMENFEGEWKDFYIKLIQTEDHPIVLEHLKRTFYKDNTLFQLVGYSDELAEAMNSYVVHNLSKKEQLSFLAISKNSNKIAGVRLTYNNSKDDDILPDFSIEVPQVQKFTGFYRPITQTLNLHETYGLTNYAKFSMASTDPEFRRQGLASELYSRGLKLVEVKGYKMVMSYFTSPHTRKVAERLGFQEIKRFYFLESIDENGVQRFPDATSDQFMACMIKQF